MNARRFLLMPLLLFAAAVCAVAAAVPKAPPHRTAAKPKHSARGVPGNVPNDVPPVPIVPPEEVPVLRFGTAELGPGQMTKVALVTVDPNGFIYTGDTDAGRVMRFTPEGKFESLFFIENPKGPWTGLAADRAGAVYVARGGRLFRYDGTSGKLLGEVQHPDGAGFFHVAPRPDFGVVASWRNAQRDDFVLVGKDGTVETIHRNAVTGASGEPAGDVLVAMDGRRTIYAAVNHLHAICLFKFTGEYVNRFGSEGDEGRPVLGRHRRSRGRRPGTDLRHRRQGRERHQERGRRFPAAAGGQGHGDCHRRRRRALRRRRHGGRQVPDPAATEGGLGVHCHGRVVSFGACVTRKYGRSPIVSSQ